MVKARVLGALGALALCAVIFGPTASAAVTRAHTTAITTVAPGSPGSESYFDLARKDCVGTARNTSSKVWFTVADGVLSDTYWPTVDATNVHTLQYLVTDGHSFTDLQTRDMTYKVIPDFTGMSCTIVASNAAHGYSITTTYIADPGRDAVLMRVRFHGHNGDQLYVRLDPLAGGTGGGGTQNAGPNSALLTKHGVPVAFNTNTKTDAVNRDYAVPTYMALESSDGFSSASVGYADSASDGQTMLDSAHSLTPYNSAPNGHVTLTAGLSLPHDGTVDLALGFGTTENQAVHVAGHSVKKDFNHVWSDYERQWLQYDQGLRKPSRWLGHAAVREYYASVNVVKASEDKTFPGAIAAGLASPWGQSVPAGTFDSGDNLPKYFGSYREVFARDLYEAFAGLLVAGDVHTAQDAALFLFERQQQSDGSMPRNSLENGLPAPDTGGLQLDETSYPILMAWQSGLALYKDKSGSLYTNHVIPAADFLVAHGPSDGVERWEEQNGYSPSTIAAEIAGLTAAAAIAQANNDPVRANVYQATADDFARNIKSWTVTTNGPDSSAPYFIRLSKTGDPNAAITYGLGNGGPTLDQRTVIDAGFLELVRLGILSASDPAVVNSVGVVDNHIEVTTPSGPGFYRYGNNAANGSADGYGDCYQPSQTSCALPGAPWAPTGVGTGHLWPVLSGEHGEYDIAAGNTTEATQMLQSMQSMQSGQGLEPEQAWEDPNFPASSFDDQVNKPLTASIGFTDGQAAGSASPLTWAQSQYARLALALSTGRNLETPDIVSDRYVKNGPPGTLSVTISSPPTPGTDVTTSSVAVSGTTVPGATVDAEGVGAAGGTAATASTKSDASGNFTLMLPVGLGTTTITVTATQGGATGYAQTSVNSSALPGTQVFTTSDDPNDDNGPGTFQYPTDGNFTLRSFDLLGLTVNQTTTDTYVQVKIRDLAPTFGNSFGAQLLDLYVRNPSATTTSSAAAFPSRNYTIAPPDAWSERLEVQGFAPLVWLDAGGNTLGSGQLVVQNGAPGYATLILPTSAFGTVTSGWTFTVALTGQDGFSSDQARAFTQYPGGFTFGVCPNGDTATLCEQNPSTMPEVMDTITPPGVSQATELNPLNGPVVLQGVTVP
jgi:glucoamylase